MPMRFLTITIVLMSMSLLSYRTAMQNTYARNHAFKSITHGNPNTDSLKKVFAGNIDFFCNQLLKGHAGVIKNYLKKYQPITCQLVTYRNSDLKADFEGVKTIKGIYNSEKADEVFVIPPFNSCDDGESYCFYNKALPRLYTDSYCCHPSNLFVLPDIDEDGIREIGIYHSSCSSRFKALIVYSLKKGRWEKIAESSFDTFMKDPEKTKFDTLVRKISKGKFKICDFADGKTQWETVVMK